LGQRTSGAIIGILSNHLQMHRGCDRGLLAAPCTICLA
jgi:hypothetical protein